jgi:hypothetical protein
VIRRWLARWRRPDLPALMAAAHRHPADEPETAHDDCADCCSLDLRRMCNDCLYYLTV